jgi:cytochrome P450
MSDTRAIADVAIRSPQYLRDPMGAFARLRSECPVAWSEQDQSWMISTYEAAHRTLQDSEAFSNEAYNTESSPNLLVLGQDPPIHSQYRRLLNPWLSPGVTERLMPKIEAYSTELLDRVVERGQCDVVLEYGNPYPALVVLELCGLPMDEWLRFAEPNHALQYAEPGTPAHQEAIDGMIWIAGQIHQVAAARREDPRDDLISALATADVDGQLVPLEDVVGITLTVVGGGVDTTTSLYANALRYLHHHHDDRTRLIERPDLIPTACEEFLREFTPAQILSRSVRREIELEGQRLCPGERVNVAIVAANHDEKAFPEAAHVDIERWPNRHAAFGMGIHRCVGSHLARAMIVRMIQDTLARLPDYVIDEAGARHYGQPIVNGWVTMPITFTPGARQGSGVDLPR